MNLERFVENNLDNILTVEEICHLPGFNSCIMGRYTLTGLSYNEAKFYTKMKELKRCGQLLLNLYYQPEYYKICVIPNYQRKYSLLENQMEENMNQSPEKMKSFLIEIICEYISYYQMIMDNSINKETKSKDFTEESFESLIKNICFYCDNLLDPYIEVCDYCGADLIDMKDYAKNHMQTLRRERNSNLNNLRTDIEKIIEVDEKNIYDNQEKISTNKSIKSAKECKTCGRSFEKYGLECFCNRTKDDASSESTLLYDFLKDDKMEIKTGELKFGVTRIDSTPISKTSFTRCKEMEKISCKNNSSEKVHKTKFDVVAINKNQWMCNICVSTNIDDLCENCDNPRTRFDDANFPKRTNCTDQKNLSENKNEKKMFEKQMRRISKNIYQNGEENHYDDIVDKYTMC